MKAKYYLIFLFFISFNLNAQNNYWKIYNNLNSPIKDLSTASININQNNNIWFSDLDGRLYRFNPFTENWFVVNNNEQTNNLAEKIKILSRDSTTYFITFGSIIKNSGNDWSIYHSKKNDSAFTFQDAILTDSNIILTSWYGIRFFKDKITRNIDMSNSNLNTNDIHNVAKDKNGILWFATDSGLARWDNNNSFTLIPRNLMNNDIYISSMIFDTNNTLYIGSKKHGVYKYENEIFSKIICNFNVEDSVIISLKVDKFNNLWIASGGGLIKYNNGYITKFDSSNSPMTEFFYPRDITFDSLNIVWITVDDVGLVAYNENGFPLSKVETLPLEEIPFYPNPVDKYFNMSFEIKHNANIIIDIYDIAGNKIATALNELRAIGTTEFNYDVSKLQNGTYILKLSNGPWSESIKFVVNR